MAIEQPLFKIGLFPSDDDRSNTALNQFFGVQVGVAKNVVGTNTGNAAIVAPTAGGPIIGVLQNNPIQGEACELTALGITKARCTGAFSVGDALMVDAQGGFKKSDGGASTTTVAIAVEQGVSGAIVSVLLK
jgi:hypothetical protein